MRLACALSELGGVLAGNRALETGERGPGSLGLVTLPSARWMSSGVIRDSPMDWIIPRLRFEAVCEARSHPMEVITTLHWDGPRSEA